MKNGKEKKQGVFSRLLSYGEGYERFTLTGCVLAGISAVLVLVPYYFIWKIVHEALLPGASGMNYAQMVHDGWMAVLFTAIHAVLYFFALMLTHYAAFNIAGNMRLSGMRHLLRLPLGYFTNKESGALRKIIDENASLTEDLLAHKLADTTASFVTPIVAVALLFVFDWRMGLACILMMALSMVAMMSMMSGKYAGFYRRWQEANEKISGEAVEYVRGIPVVKTFQQTIHSFRSFHKAITECGDLAKGYAMSCRTGQTFFLTFVHGAFFLLIPIAILLAAYGSSSGWEVLSNFIFYALFAPACGGTINKVMYAHQAVMDATEAVIKLDKIESAPVQEDNGAMMAAEGNGVEFEAVHFKYSETEREVLSDVTLSAAEGKVTALVGPSGGGKTTAASLIPRFFDVTDGRVMLGSADVREMGLERLMKQVSFVFQSSRLFKMSIRENLLIGKPDATDEELNAALNAASCDDFIARLPEGIDTQIGSKGTYLSGGEVQRVALARVLLKDAPVIVLDEATAYADPDNELVIQKTISKMTKGKTVMMIAHRLPTIQNSDQILVVDKGRVTERGTHEELLSLNGLYRKMWDDYQSAVQWRITSEGIA